MISFLTPVWIRAVVMIGLIAASFIGGFSVRGAYCDRDRLALEAANREEVIQTVEAQAGVSQRTEAAQLKQQVEIRTVYKTLLKEVPVVVQSAPDPACDLSVGWVRLWNSASAGSLSGAATELDATPSEVTSTDVLETHIDGAEVYAETAARLEGLQLWVLEQRAAHQGEVK